jgi:Fe-Mn family superoxide dismutase
MTQKIIDNGSFPYSLSKLPYDPKALEPYITENTLSFHHGKHHMAYINNLNNLIKETELESKDIDQIILMSAKDQTKMAIFNNAAQVWNHNFYWHSMKPQGGGEPKGRLRDQIEKDFGSFQSFKDKFKEAGVTQFGSGWAWLVEDQGQLKITKTGNADLPMVRGQNAIITADVWEHAYYLDYQNRRPDYLTIFLDHLINWDFAEDMYNNFRK